MGPAPAIQHRPQCATWLTGQIPTTIGQMSSLIDLRYVAIFSGIRPNKIPRSLANTRVCSLSVSSATYSLRDNKLSGSIPTELGNLTNLEVSELVYDDMHDRQ